MAQFINEPLPNRTEFVPISAEKAGVREKMIIEAEVSF